LKAGFHTKDQGEPREVGGETHWDAQAGIAGGGLLSGQVTKKL